MVGNGFGAILAERTRRALKHLDLPRRKSSTVGGMRTLLDDREAFPRKSLIVSFAR
jgi:hypothetical protein